MPGVEVTNDILANFAKFLKGGDPDDPEYQREVMRPVEVKEDVRLMEQRKRVTLILQSELFRNELNGIVSSQIQSTINPPTCHPGYIQLNKSFNENSFYSTTTPASATASLRRESSSATATLQSGKKILPINDVRDSISETEAQYRCKIASLFRVVDFFGWSNSFYNNISLRLGNEADEFLINPFGLLYHDITASSLVKVDQQGNVLHPGSSNLEIDKASWALHSAIFSKNSKIRCIIHLSTPATLALSSSASSLLPLCQEAILVGPSAVISSPSNDYVESLQNTFALKEAEGGGDHRHKKNKNFPHVVFLRGKGLFAVGSSVEEAWFYAYNAVHACEFQLNLSSISLDDLWLPSAKECAEQREYVLASMGNEPDSPAMRRNIHAGGFSEWRIGEIEFEGLMRHLDNVGLRTGYPYHIPNYGRLDKMDDTTKRINSLKRSPSPKRSREDVEIPALVVASDYSHPRRHKAKGAIPHWMATHNQYLRMNSPYGDDEDDDEEEEDKNDENDAPTSTKTSQSKRSERVGHWHLKNIPLTPLKSATLPGTLPGTIETTPNRYAPQGENPKEFKEIQRWVKEKYYQDLNTAGPSSRLMEGLTMEDLIRLKADGLVKMSEDGNTLIRLATTSKAIISKDHRDETAWLPSSVMSGNPFEQITDDDLERYKREIEIKSNPELARLVREEEEKKEREHQEKLKQQKQKEEEERKRHFSPEVSVVSKSKVSKSPSSSSPHRDRDASLPRHEVKWDTSTKAAGSGVNVTSGNLDVTVARSPSARETATVSSGVSATLPTPSRITALKSDTSGAEGSHDDTEREATDSGVEGKKKKRKFKFPSFSSKKKDRKSSKK